MMLNGSSGELPYGYTNQNTEILDKTTVAVSSPRKNEDNLSQKRKKKKERFLIPCKTLLLYQSSLNFHKLNANNKLRHLGQLHRAPSFRLCGFKRTLLQNEH